MYFREDPLKAIEDARSSQSIIKQNNSFGELPSARITFRDFDSSGLMVNEVDFEFKGLNSEEALDGIKKISNLYKKIKEEKKQLPKKKSSGVV